MHYFKQWMKIGLAFLCISGPVFAWNDVGHKLVAQIAMDHMSEDAKHLVQVYNQAMEAVYLPMDFIESATWLDKIRYRNIKWYNQMHYIDIPFSQDNTPLPAYSPSNALTAIQNALHTLSGKYPTYFDKGFALRVLIHVVGDIHQPLHATTRVSAEYPKGDSGGNRFPIRSRVAKNLHAYWDKGGGLLLNEKNAPSIQKKARFLIELWPCDTHMMDLDPEHWVQESFELGMNKAYILNPGAKPNEQYEKEVQSISGQRIALAGCRLAAVLNAKAQGLLLANRIKPQVMAMQK